jgi:hypothetical protein
MPGKLLAIIFISKEHSFGRAVASRDIRRKKVCSAAWLKLSVHQKCRQPQLSPLSFSTARRRLQNFKLQPISHLGQAKTFHLQVWLADSFS